MRIIAALFCVGLTTSALAQNKYDPGASDTEIRLGESAPFSGPVSSIGAIAKSEMAYFTSVNDRGGINGRKVNVIAGDDAFTPPKAVEQARRLVEQEKVLMLLSVGTPTGAAVQRYLNRAQIPQFTSSGASRFVDPVNSPWTMGFQPKYQIEGKIYAEYILANIKDAKIGILYENDDYGKDLIAGMKAGLKDKAAQLIVKEASYEVSDPTIDSQIVSLQAAGANVVFIASAPKFGAQAIRKIYDIGWRPTRFLANAASSIGETLTPAGLDKATGLMSTRYFKDPNDPTWANDAGVNAYLTFLKKYLPDGNPRDLYNVLGYSRAQLVEHILKAAGGELIHANIMKQATNLKDVELAMLVPGIKLNTTPQQYAAINQEQMMRFDGTAWVGFGDIQNGL